MIKALAGEYDLLTQPTTDTQARLRVKSSAAKKGRTVHIAGTPSTAMIRASADSSPLNIFPWDFFYSIYEKAKEATHWVLERVGGYPIHRELIHQTLKNIIFTLAGEVYTFACGTVAEMGKALSWVFAKIEVWIKELIDFVDFIFKWNDILTFSDSIVTYINVSLEA